MKTDGLLRFIYILLRDEVPAGMVERIIVEHVEKTNGTKVIFTNHFLADYAAELARRIMQ